MSSKPQSPSAPAAKNGHGQGRGTTSLALIDVTFHNWIFELRGTTAVVGKLCDEDEDKLRDEVRYTRKAPVATLCPSYILSFTEPWRMSGQDYETVPLQRSRSIEMVMRTFLGHASHQPIHFELTGFAYISQWPEAMRKELFRAIQEVERCATVARVGLATAMEGAQQG